ncbi:MAG: triose-phosphate isomerase [Parasporobacterium sp.]|jgi:triosephosphate isomerase|nr:triose-phosphate isomerase [Parasporobacterium sp.]
MRRKIAAGNWKMNKTPQEAKALIEELLPLVDSDDVDVIFCVPFIDIPVAIELLKGSRISVGAQNMHFEDKGAFTGEISAKMLYESGVEYVIIGHSERRQYFAETDETVNKKILKAFETELIPIVCCGETLEQREAGITLEWIKGQIKGAFAGVCKENAAQTIIAYEPIWAIGTGKVATKEQAEEVCRFIRETICELYDQETADKIRILYGGSVTGDSANELFSMEDIDGGLVGGASLKADFGRIVHYNK